MMKANMRYENLLPTPALEITPLREFYRYIKTLNKESKS